MKRPLRILNVEDEEADSLLLRRHLERSGYEVTLRRVETDLDFEYALKAQTWDAVIADYWLPRFKAPEALAILKDRGIDLPFIIVSGVIGEQAAVEAMRSGAHDYLMKDALGRLVPAIERELKEAAHRRSRLSAERRRDVEHSVTRILAESESIPDAAPEILRAIAEGLGWEVGALWIVGQQHCTLRCSVTYAENPVSYERFLTMLRSLILPPGDGPVGKAFQENRPIWEKDLSSAGVPQERVAAAGDLLSMFGCPIRSGTDPVGVISFYSKEARQPDEELLRVMEAIGSQVGQFLERRRAEAALQQSQAQLAGQKQILEMVAGGAPLTAVLDEVCRHIDLHSCGAATAFLLMDPGGQRLSFLTGPGFPASARAALRSVPVTPSTFCCGIVAIPGSEGLRVWCAPVYAEKGDGLGTFALLYPSGRPPEPQDLLLVENSIHLVAMAIERKRVDEARDRKLQSLIEHMHEGVVAVDEDRRILVVNKAAMGLLDLTEPAEGHPMTKAGLPGLFVNMIQAAFEGGEPVPDGSLLIGGNEVNASVSAVATGLGRPYGAVAVLRDVTAEMQLRRLQESLVANVSHELRGPLASLTAIMEAMSDGLIPEDRRPGYLRASLGELGRLRRLTDDLLELAQLDAGMVRTVPREFDLHGVIGELPKKWGLRFESASLRLTVECPQVAVLADPDRVEQVVSNFLDNAVRYTQAGGAVRVMVMPEETSVRIAVADTGPGIPPEHLSHIWDRFYTADQARTRVPTSGTGLGLSIARQLVELMGGTVGAHSQVGVGSAFEFTLPYARRAGG